MHCSVAARQLQLYIDRRLPYNQICILEAHISTCAVCRRELLLLEEVEGVLRGMELVAEPANLTANIMQRIALNTEKAVKNSLAPVFRPSLLDLIAATVLATLATLGLILCEPALRSTLPFANGHDPLSLICMNIWNTLININSATLMAIFWIIGTALGVWITLFVAGTEVRTMWFRAVMDRLPAW